MDQPLFLRSGVRLAAVGEDLVTLDVNADAYGGLAGVAWAIAQCGPGGQVSVKHPDVANILLEAGLVTTTPLEDDFPPPPPLPTRSAWRTGAEAATTSDRRRLAAAYLAAAPATWRASFRSILASVAGGRPAGVDPSPAALERDARVFDQLMPFVPFQGECFFRSRLLLAFLRTQARDATWVFGVRTYPFQAHCWLQAGDTVLDDAAERVCGYVPILAV